MTTATKAVPESMRARLSQTPWGKADSITKLADGIYAVSTPSHGGLWISQDRLADMPEASVEFARKWSGSEQWWEEDCAWAFVAVVHPEAFDSDAVTAARMLANRLLSQPH
jgi:hypothetical protein